MATPTRRLVRPALLYHPTTTLVIRPADDRLTRSICDLQEKFRSAIHEFPRVVSTTQKLLRAAQLLDIPVFATTQLRGKLGETCPELGLDALDGIKTKAHVDKSAFSMFVPELKKAFYELGEEKREVVV
ncbi:hypothetical protein LTR33_013437, partial [Friedmanniomyces endolithicus]